MSSHDIGLQGKQDNSIFEPKNQQRTMDNAKKTLRYKVIKKKQEKRKAKEANQIGQTINDRQNKPESCLSSVFIPKRSVHITSFKLPPHPAHVNKK